MIALVSMYLLSYEELRRLAKIFNTRHRKTMFHSIAVTRESFEQTFAPPKIAYDDMVSSTVVKSQTQPSSSPPFIIISRYTATSVKRRPSTSKSSANISGKLPRTFVECPLGFPAIMLYNPRRVRLSRLPRGDGDGLPGAPVLVSGVSPWMIFRVIRNTRPLSHSTCSP